VARYELRLAASFLAARVCCGLALRLWRKLVRQCERKCQRKRADWLAALAACCGPVREATVTSVVSNVATGGQPLSTATHRAISSVLYLLAQGWQQEAGVNHGRRHAVQHDALSAQFHALCAGRQQEVGVDHCRRHAARHLCCGADAAVLRLHVKRLERGVAAAARQHAVHAKASSWTHRHV
jgi:hypothetical protein